jgi:hypothetical protein
MDTLAPLITTIGLLAILTVWAWMFWDMINNPDIPANARTYWLLAFIFLSIFAAVYYYVNVYRNRE